MSDEYVIRIVPESVDSSGKGKSGGGMAGLGGTLGKLGSILAVAGVALSILKPIMPMIKGLGKMIGEFLRPIADVVMMLLAPILSLMRPLLIMFKGLMAPFKQAAMVGIAAGQKLIAQGMALGAGTEEGKGLIGEGIEGSFQSASLMMSGFVEVLMKPFTNIDFMGIGDSIQGGLDKWQSSAITGVLRTVMLSETVDDLSDKFGNLREGAGGALNLIEGQVAALKGVVDVFTIENFQTDLETAKTISETALAIFNEDLATLQTTADELGTPLGTLVGWLLVGVDPAKSLGDNFKNLVGQMSDLNKVLAGAAATTGIKEQTKFGWGELGRATAGGAAVGAAIGTVVPVIGTAIGAVAGGLIGGITDTISQLSRNNDNEQQWTAWASDLLATTTKGMFDSNTAVEKGFGEMKTTTDIYMGKSLIPDALQKGFNEMYLSTDNFQLALGNMGKKIDTTADGINSAVDRIKGLEADARRSASKARANADSSSLGAVI